MKKDVWNILQNYIFFDFDLCCEANPMVTIIVTPAVAYTSSFMHSIFTAPTWLWMWNRVKSNGAYEWWTSILLLWLYGFYDFPPKYAHNLWLSAILTQLVYFLQG